LFLQYSDINYSNLIFYDGVFSPPSWAMLCCRVWQFTWSYGAGLGRDGRLDPMAWGSCGVAHLGWGCPSWLGLLWGEAMAQAAAPR